MSLTQTEAEIIRKVLKRLQPTEETASQNVVEALAGHNLDSARLYLETWVIPCLQGLLPETRDIEHAKRMAR
jgi:hypothetical protein